MEGALSDSKKRGKVWFVGAGPGDPDLITVKGRRLVRRADLVLYAGSLVPEEVIRAAGSAARVEDSSPLNLNETHALLLECVRAGGMAVRLHTGDPSLYGAVREQARLLERDKAPYEIVPGVTSACAAAAAADVSFTVPGGTQSLIFTRLAGRTPVPETESISRLGTHRTAMAVYLSGKDIPALREQLLEAGMDPKTLVVAAHRVGWPGERIIRTTVRGLEELTADPEVAETLTRQTLFLVLPGQDDETASLLYDPSFSHGRRK